MSGAAGDAAAGTAPAAGAQAAAAIPALPAPSAATRLFFGFTAVVETTKFQVYETYLIFYYAQVLGLKGSLAGLAVAIAIIADAILDPLIGSFSDSFRGPLGRRHTLMFAAILPTGLFVWLLFDAPAGLGQAGLFAWMLAFCLLARISGSFYSVPAAAVAAELTENATVRAELGIWRQAVTSAIQLGMTWLLFNLAFVGSDAFRNGMENPANYGRFALIVTGVLLLAALVGAFGTLKPLQAFERARVAVRPQLFSVKTSLVATWRAMVDQRNFRAMFFGLLFAGVMGSYFRALNLHLGTYFWSLSAAQTGAWLMSVQVATFVAAIASRLLVGKVEPKALYITGVAMLMLSYVMPPLAKLLGLTPPVGSDALLQMLYLSNLGVGVGMGLIMTLSLVMFAETTDEYAYEKRESRTGMLLAFLPLGNKMASSLGKLAAGIVVQWVALPVGQKGAQLDPGSLQHLGIAVVALTAVAGCAALWSYASYHLPRARHAEIVRGLEALRAAARTEPAR